MDQLHEELKQVVDTEMVDSEEDPPPAEPASALPSAKDGEKEGVTTPPGAETNSQSDTDYETCDSGMSSERSSVSDNLKDTY